MNLLDKQDRCPACRRSLSSKAFSPGNDRLVDLVFCPNECLRGAGNDFNATTSHSTRLPIPHFHVSCDQCKFSWLEKVPDIEIVSKAW